MSCTREIKVALAGIAGYGNEYLECLLNDRRAAGTRLVGVVDPYPERCRHLDQLRRRDIPIYSTLHALFDASSLDLVMIATPIHLHAQHTCAALKHGASVLCEKPLAATLEDVRRIADGERAAGDRFVAIGYQWSFSEAIQSLKRDIIAGAFGRALRMKSIAFFPRPISYFSRNNWAGRLRTSDGSAVLDSPTNNATAHYLHNMFYLLGETRETSTMPASVQAELYRANDVENYDTTALRARLASGTELLFYSTYAVSQRLGPRCEFEFENAVIEYDFSVQPRFVARFRDGRQSEYGDPN